MTDAIKCQTCAVRHQVMRARQEDKQLMCVFFFFPIQWACSAFLRALSEVHIS